MLYFFTIVVNPQGTELADFFEKSFWEVRVFPNLDEANTRAGRSVSQ